MFLFKKKMRSFSNQYFCFIQPVHTQLEAKNRDRFTIANVIYLSDPKAGSHIIE